ncbi:MAG: TylF/MycF family methyltransferase [Actinomycetota bacterium]|nr:TylF/MycF family methyltransferase [Actinomycetota bacterium]
MSQLQSDGDLAAEAAEAGPSGVRKAPEALYLDLIKRCLTRYGFDDDLTPVAPIPAWRKRAWDKAVRVLDRHDWVMMRRVQFRPELREEGLDWPRTAETMVGLRRLDNLQHCIESALASGVAGDVIECGVWRGGASIFMRAVLAAHGDTERTVWVADSFQGLPKPDPGNVADRGDQHWTQSFLAVSLAEVKRNFSRYALLDQQVRFLKGWFSDTLPGAPIERLAVLRVDGDMYGSTMDVLDALYPKVSVGGFVIIDDFGAVPGCRAAVEDYRSEHGITEPIERIDWAGVFWQRQR